ncbi:MAG: peptidoglycan DD-metalloendopeptidase family protein [Flexilinea sp.]|nr:peptidoglycan DD-metalloendopeptidase family protein [Flexilinea sp.]
MRKPFDGNFPVTQRFGEKITDPAGHTGIDYALYLGTPVLAALEGKVVRTAYLGTGYGNHVVLEHPTGIETVYAHLSSIAVSPGETVREGQEIGRSGSTGNSTGPHLHFEVCRRGVPIDPEDYLSAGQASGPGTLRVSVPELYVRSGPGIEYSIVDSLKQGATVRGETSTETVWLKIGKNRWVARRYQGKDFCETVE